MKLDVVVPTYNRSGLLRRTLTSLMEAPAPDGLEVSILVIDNNSSDDTAEVVRQMQADAQRSLVYLRETKQGLSHARNAGLSGGSGEIIGFVDDDEEVDRHWFSVIAREFSDEATEFIGGPYLANCSVPMPAWLPAGYNAVIGVHEVRERALFGPGFAGNLNGGNAVLRRAVFDRVGAYDVRLGRSGKGLLSEEDAELYRRILDAGLRGFYVPDLVIYHHIPASRLTRAYYRKWCYWRGVSQGVADKNRREPTPYLFGAPRYRVRQAFIGLLCLPKNFSSQRGSGMSFQRELALWDWVGFLYGKYFVRIDSFYAEKK